MPGRNRGEPVHKAINVNLLFSPSGAAKSVGSRITAFMFFTSHGFPAHHFPLKKYTPEPVSTHRPPFSIGLTANPK